MVCIQYKCWSFVWYLFSFYHWWSYSSGYSISENWYFSPFRWSVWFFLLLFVIFEKGFPAGNFISLTTLILKSVTYFISLVSPYLSFFNQIPFTCRKMFFLKRLFSLWFWFLLLKSIPPEFHFMILSSFQILRFDSIPLIFQNLYFLFLNSASSYSKFQMVFPTLLLSFRFDFFFLFRLKFFLTISRSLLLPFLQVFFLIWCFRFYFLSSDSELLSLLT